MRGQSQDGVPTACTYVRGPRVHGVWCRQTCEISLSLIKQAVAPLHVGIQLARLICVYISNSFLKCPNMNNILSASLTPMSVCFGGILCLLTWSFVLVVYRLYFHPLAKFPGPRLAIATYWFEFYYDIVQHGQYTFKLRELHEQYGRDWISLLYALRSC